MSGDSHPAEAGLPHDNPWEAELAAAAVVARRTAFATAHAVGLLAMAGLLAGVVLWLPIGESALAEDLRDVVWRGAGVAWVAHALLSTAVAVVLWWFPGVQQPDEARAAVAVGHGVALLVESAAVIAVVARLLG